MEAMSHFVYALVESGAVRYVGYTSRLEERGAEHRRQHPCWGMKVLEACSTYELVLRQERYWIKKLFEAGEPLINIAIGGSGSAPGLKRSYLTKARISATLKGRTISPEWRAKISMARMGQRASPETRAKLRAGAKHRPTQSVETRAKRSATLMGHSLSPETRAKISTAHKGKLISAETRAKISKAQKGKIKSAETRAKLSAVKTGRPWTAAERVAQEHRHARAKGLVDEILR